MASSAAVAACSVGDLAGLNVGYGRVMTAKPSTESSARSRRDLPEARLGLSTRSIPRKPSLLAGRGRRRASPGGCHGHRPPNVLLGILTADCAPVLFSDHRSVIVGAAHAGWRGALAGITDATIAAMEQLARAARTSTPPSARASRSHPTRWTRLPRPVPGGRRRQCPFFHRGNEGQAAVRPRALCRPSADCRGHRGSRSLEPRHVWRRGSFL